MRCLLNPHGRVISFLAGTLHVVDLVARDGGDDAHGVVGPGLDVEGRLGVHDGAHHGVLVPMGGERGVNFYNCVQGESSS